MINGDGMYYVIVTGGVDITDNGDADVLLLLLTIKPYNGSACLDGIFYIELLLLSVSSDNLMLSFSLIFLSLSFLFIYWYDGELLLLYLLLSIFLFGLSPID